MNSEYLIKILYNLNGRSTTVHVGHDFKFLNSFPNLQFWRVFNILRHVPVLLRDLYLFDAGLKYPANIIMTTVNIILTFYY